MTPQVLAPGTVIPVARTQPSFDISKLLNGFEPLFALLNPHQVDNLTTAIVRAMQGDAGSVTTLIAETTRLAESYSGTDEILDGVLANLDTVLGSVAERGGDLDSTIVSAKNLFDGFAVAPRGIRHLHGPGLDRGAAAVRT